MNGSHLIMRMLWIFSMMEQIEQRVMSLKCLMTPSEPPARESPRLHKLGSLRTLPPHKINRLSFDRRLASRMDQNGDDCKALSRIIH